MKCEKTLNHGSHYCFGFKRKSKCPKEAVIQHPIDKRMLCQKHYNKSMQKLTTQQEGSR